MKTFFSFITYSIFFAFMVFCASAQNIDSNSHVNDTSKLSMGSFPEHQEVPQKEAGKVESIQQPPTALATKANSEGEDYHVLMVCLFVLVDIVVVAMLFQSLWFLRKRKRINCFLESIQVVDNPLFADIKKSFKVKTDKQTDEEFVASILTPLIELFLAENQEKFQKSYQQLSGAIPKADKKSNQSTFLATLNEVYEDYARCKAKLGADDNTLLSKKMEEHLSTAEANKKIIESWENLSQTPKLIGQRPDLENTALRSLFNEYLYMENDLDALFSQNYSAEFKSHYASKLKALRGKMDAMESQPSIRDLSASIQDAVWMDFHENFAQSEDFNYDYKLALYYVSVLYSLCKIIGDDGSMPDLMKKYQEQLSRFKSKKLGTGLPNEDLEKLKKYQFRTTGNHKIDFDFISKLKEIKPIPFLYLGTYYSEDNLK